MNMTIDDYMYGRFVGYRVRWARRSAEHIAVDGGGAEVLSEWSGGMKYVVRFPVVQRRQLIIDETTSISDCA